MATKLKPPPVQIARSWRLTELLRPSSISGSELSLSSESPKSEGLLFGMPLRIPTEFNPNKSTNVIEYKRLLAALNVNDTFQIWVAYLGLREYVFNRENPILDRTMFSRVLLSLKPFNMVSVTAKGVDWAERLSTMDNYAGVLSPKKSAYPSLLDVLPSLPLEVRRNIRALPVEQMAFAKSAELASRFPMVTNSSVAIWNRISVVEQDIVRLFGGLSQYEYIHMMICASATRSKLRAKQMWKAMMERETVTNYGEVVNWMPTTRMWNVYIMSMCDTRTGVLKRVRGVGQTKNDVLASLEGLDYKQWIIDYIREDYDDYSIVDSSTRSAVMEVSSTPSWTSDGPSRPEDFKDIQRDTHQQGLNLLQSGIDALIYIEQMISTGVLPNNVTYSALVLALSKSGMIDAMQAVIESVWGVRPGKDIHDKVQFGSRLYPDMYTLASIFNAFASNSQRALGKEYVLLMAKTYKLTVNEFVKSVMKFNFVSNDQTATQGDLLQWTELDKTNRVT
ncbi:hypothetical protein V1512DRAFT_266066 [Lipomyces arxii]|uniref:uncharacterized protein n=1 Tax=Lipomyces arxii TaxID=56418 RepID=UPI0034CF52EB